MRDHNETVADHVSRTFWRCIFYGRRCVWFLTRVLDGEDEDAVAA